MKQLLSIGLAIATVGTVVAPAIAAPQGWVDYKDSKGNLYLGGAPNGELSVAVSGVSKTKNYTASACGLALIKSSSSFQIPSTFQIGSQTVDTATLPTQLLPKCLSTGQLEEARTSNFKTPDGTVVVVGLTPGASTAMNYLATVTKKVRVNACGWGRLSNPSTAPYSSSNTVSVNGGTPFNYQSGISVEPNLWQCKNGVTYKPIVTSGS